MTNAVTKEEVRAELAFRHPTRFAVSLDSSYEPAWFHWEIGDHLRKVYEGKVKRLIICMPPRHGKSEACSKRFPPWYLGHNEKTPSGLPLSIIAASYNASLVRSFGRSARNIAASQIYQQIFGVMPNRFAGTAAADWTLTNGNAYAAAGVNGGVTGLGASVFLIDDPIKDRKQADSAVYRENLKDWYREVAVTRLTPEGAMVVVSTRWHHDDLVGYLLREWEDENWTVLKFPAIKTEEENDYDDRKPGAALWPEKYSLKRMENLREGVGFLTFNCLYQQDPTMGEGNVLNVNDIVFDFELSEPPEFKRKISSWDTAFEKTKLADYSVGTIWGETDTGFYLIDVIRVRMRFPELKKRIVESYDKHKEDAVLIEGKASGKDLIYELQNETSLPIMQVTPVIDKVARAAAVSGRFEAGRIHAPKTAPWLNAFLTELEHFPTGDYDDQVDSTTQGIRWLSRYSGSAAA